MPGGPVVVIIIDPDEPDQENVSFVAEVLSDADRIRALADRVEAGEVQVRFAR